MSESADGQAGSSAGPGSPGGWRPEASAKGVWTPPWLAHDLTRLEGKAPAWLRPTAGENRIPAALAILVAIGLQVSLPNRYALHPRWVLPVLELLLLLSLTVLNPVRLQKSSPVHRYLGLLLVAAISVDNGFSAGTLAYDIVTGRASEDATGLLTSGAAVYLTNIIAFGLWYWEIDRGGPFARADATRLYPDFLFPQMASPEIADPDWEPRFFDYLYVSFTNAVAFSPTDTLPLTRGVKALMAAQSVVALSTVGLVVARAVNVLK